MALGGLFSAIAQGRVAAGSINILAKKPDDWSKGMVLCITVEFYAILSLLASMLMIINISALIPVRKADCYDERNRKHHPAASMPDAKAEIGRPAGRGPAGGGGRSPARYQAQADAEAADLAAQNEQAAAEREERLVSAAQMEARKTVLAAKQAVMEETYAKALEKLRNLPEARYVEVLTELLLQAAPHGAGEVLFSAQDRETVGQAAVDAANGKSGGKLTLSGETAPIQGRLHPQGRQR